MNKKIRSESDICDKFIRPSVGAAGWDGMEQANLPEQERVLRIDTCNRRIHVRSSSRTD